MSRWETMYALLVLQVTLMSVTAAIAYLVIARRQPATAKRLLAVTAALLLGLTAAACLPLPGFWSLDIWPSEAQIAPAVTSPPGGRNTIGREAPPPAGMPDVAWTKVADPTSVPAIPPDTGAPASLPRAPAVFPWTLLLKLILLAGGCVAGIRLAWGMWCTHRLLRRSRKVDSTAVLELAEQIRCSIGCRRVELRVSTEITSAATVGWRRPVLILAADWLRWSEQELTAVLAHEMTHVQSKDYLMGLVARITVALYFYHPLVRWLGTRLFLAQEAVADAAAARCVGGRANYLVALSRIALRQDRQLKSLPVLAFGSSFTTFLMRRIEMLQITDGRRWPMTRFLQGIALACLCLGAVAVSALRAPAEDAKAGSEAPAGVVRREATGSSGGNAGSEAEGTLPKIEALPPLPTSATYKTLAVFKDGSPLPTKNMVLGRYRRRTERSGRSVTIYDRGKSVTLDLDEKKAFITEYPHDDGLGYFESLRKRLTDPEYPPETKREMLGESEIDGRRAVGYRFTSNHHVFTIWADPDTLLPIQTESVSRMLPHMRMIDTDFVYNVDLDESLFNLEPPADYTVLKRTVPEESAPTEENDLVEMFRQCRENGLETFPDTLDARAAHELQTAKFDLDEERTEEQWQEIMEFSKKVHRGPQFVVELPPEADAHYAGKGVKVDATDTPIFWYRPEGKGEYRVIRADLSVVEVDAPPEIPGAEALADWGRGERASQRPWRNPAVSYDVQNMAPLVRQLGFFPFSLRNELRVRVLPGSTAEKAGIRSGDRITELDGVPVKRIQELAAVWGLLAFYPKAGKTLLEDGVPLAVLRDGERLEVRLPGDALQPFLNPTARTGSDIQDWLPLLRQIGIQPDSDEPKLSDVLTVRVIPGSPAAKAGIRSGDRITALNGERVDRVKDVIALVAWVPMDDESRQLMAREDVHLTLNREGEPVEVTLPGNVLSDLTPPSGQDGR